MTNKETYQNFTKQEKLPLFYQPWWLDAVSQQNSWDVAISYAKNGEINGVLPYLIKKKTGVTIVENPILTPFLGPWVKPLTTSHNHKIISHQQKVITNLLALLPKATYTNIKLAPSTLPWLIFQWQDFILKPHVDQYIPHQPIDTIRQGLKKNTRYIIRKAESQVDILLEDNPRVFYDIQRNTFERQGLSMPFSYDFFLNLYNEIQQRNQGQLYFAKDKVTGEYLSTAYLCWDHDTAYALLTGTTPNGRKTKANALLKWKRIEWAMEHGKNFSFLGSSLKGVFDTNQNFTSTQRTGFIAYKCKNKWWEIFIRWRNWV